METGRHDTDYGIRVSCNSQGGTENIFIPAEMALPVAVAEDGDIRSADFSFFCRIMPSYLRIDAECSRIGMERGELIPVALPRSVEGKIGPFSKEEEYLWGRSGR